MAAKYKDEPTGIIFVDLITTTKGQKTPFILNVSMNFQSKRVLLIILGVMAIICSRTLFFFIKDIEGPNLLIIGVLAIALFCLSFAVNAFAPSKMDHLKKVSMAVGVQLLSVIVLYFFMR